MHEILSYLYENKLFSIVFVLVVTYFISRLLAPVRSGVRPEDLVPSYRRFERRETEMGDRRQQESVKLTALERRLGLRRSGS